MFLMLSGLVKEINLLLKHHGNKRHVDEPPNKQRRTNDYLDQTSLDGLTWHQFNFSFLGRPCLNIGNRWSDPSCCYLIILYLKR